MPTYSFNAEKIFHGMNTLRLCMQCSLKGRFLRKLNLARRLVTYCL
uniref:Uncharacterized protein n=1 Tax=Arundo donax TaxID=35708 RepID=A0A0A9ESR0_ARUDO